MDKDTKIGIIFASLTDTEYVEKSIEPWLQIKQEKPENLIICAVSAFFKEYNQNIPEEQTTRPYLRGLLKDKKIDYLIDGPDGLLLEHELRNIALQFLLNNHKLDYIFIVDGDEFYSVDGIKKITRYITLDEFVVWYKVHYKNILFNGDVYTNGFAPPRIFKVKVGDLLLSRCYWDNDMIYKKALSDKTFEEVAYTKLPSQKIPDSIHRPLHYTWLNNERSRDKIQYQKKRGWLCSYEWDYKNNQLIFNKEFFVKNNLIIPQTFSLEESSY